MPIPRSVRPRAAGLTLPMLLAAAALVAGAAGAAEPRSGAEPRATREPPPSAGERVRARPGAGPDDEVDAESALPGAAQVDTRPDLVVDDIWYFPVGGSSNVRKVSQIRIVNLGLSASVPTQAKVRCTASMGDVWVHDCLVNSYAEADNGDVQYALESFTLSVPAIEPGKSAVLGVNKYFPCLAEWKCQVGGEVDTPDFNDERDESNNHWGELAD